MNAVSVYLTDDTERALRQQAGRAGQTLEEYMADAAERLSMTAEPQPKYISAPEPTAAELARLLGDLAAGPPLPVLPADFSRANIYDDHD